MSAAFAKPSDYRFPASFDRQAGHAVSAVACGTRVTMRRGVLISDWWIIGEEAEPTRGRLAATSPLGRALLGARVGDTIEYHAGHRVEEIRILAIRSA